MKFFIDTAEIAEIRDLATTGLVDGVTTNPSLVAKSGRDFREVIDVRFFRLALAALAHVLARCVIERAGKFDHVDTHDDAA